MSANIKHMCKIPAYIIFCIALLTSNVDAKECSYRTIYSDEYMKSVDATAELAKASIPILEKLQAANAKAKTTGDQPIMEGLSKEDIAKFTELSAKLKRNQLAQYVQSRRTRDISAINDI